MNINRNNYEEYFLLYVDNELSAAEKNMVTVFVAENPDLHKELMMLQQTVINADEIIFSDKTGLLKPQPLEAGLEEKLLLLLDNELKDKEKQQLLSLTKKDKAVNEEWNLLQQAKLSPADIIIFKDKASLYKKEDKDRKVIPIRWWQMAAAAMLIGAGLWGTVSYINRGSQPATETATAVTKETVKPGTSSSSTVIAPNDSSETNTNVNKQNNNTTAIAPTKLKKTGGEKPTTPVDNNKQQNMLPKEQDNKDVALQQHINDNAPNNGLQKINSIESNKPDVATVEPKTKIETVEVNSIPKNEYAINTASVENEEISFAGDEDDDNRKKSKLGGFFKRVKRTFERKTKIKTGSGDDVKIANMSFAMH